MDQLPYEVAPIVPDLVVLVARHCENRAVILLYWICGGGCLFARKVAGELCEMLAAACIVRLASPSALLNVRP